MTKILINTIPMDYHAAAVQCGIEALGGECYRWIGGNWPQRQFHYFHADTSRINVHVKDDGLGAFNLSSADVVWMRRVHSPVMPNNIDALDMPFLESEIKAWSASWRSVIGRKAVWVNNFGASRDGESKPYQLMVATEVGLEIPNTLMTNDPAEVTRFVSNQKNGAIFKNHTGVRMWEEGGKSYMFRTVEIDASSLPPTTSIQHSPGIYQERIDKAFELRVVYMNGEILCASLDTQAHRRTKMDWRVPLDAPVKIEPFELPDELKAKICVFMQKMDLLFGSLDFIVTPDGRYVFLEVNQQGQFLWLEKRNPDIKMLDRFCRFLLNPLHSHHTDMHAGNAATQLSLESYEQSGAIEQLMEADSQCCVEGPVRQGFYN